MITPTSLDALADAVVAAGVTQIQGGVVGDGSRYDDEFFAPSWVNDIRGIEAGPYDALLVNDARVKDSSGPKQVANDPNAGAGERADPAAARTRGVDRRRREHRHGAERRHQRGELVQSAPMTGVVAEMLSTSDNNTAEMLLKEIGVHSGGAGSTDAGVAVMTATLTAARGRHDRHGRSPTARG